LQHLGRIACLDHQRRGGVPQVMNPEAVTERGAMTGRYESGAPPVGQPHDAAPRHGEHEVIGPLAVDGGGQVDDDEPRNRDGPGLVRLWGTEDDTPADIGGHQSRQHLIAGTGTITRHSRTLLPPRTAYPAIPHHRSAFPLAKRAGLPCPAVITGA
jgi:hypothetical protein